MKDSSDNPLSPHRLIVGTSGVPTYITLRLILRCTGILKFSLIFLLHIFILTGITGGLPKY